MMIACPVSWLNGTAICTANMPNAHAALNHHSLSDSSERKAAKEGLAMVAMAAATVIG
jgi:hypothetical protein